MTRRLALVAVLLLATACTSSAGPPRSTSVPAASTARPPSSSPHTTIRPPSPPHSTATSTAPRSVQAVFDAMSERQRIGQLLMVDCPTSGVTEATRAAIADADAGSVILDGTSYAGVSAIASLTRSLQALGPRGVGLLIATDQEGGLVQRLQGSGFTRIVSGLAQGQIPPSTLQGYAQGWGQQLRAAGVDINLAPVMDTVPAGFGSNPPIGDLDREFGHTPAVVSAHGVAVVRGMAAAGVAATVKHFPGLGRVTGNTDTSSGVTDTVTTRNDPYLAPFRAAVAAGVPFVMMSTAIYSRIDPGTPAAFSKTIVTGMLRGSLGFGGLIISDDLGGAKQVAGYSLGQRAVDFVAAGGDVVLTVDASAAAPMAEALLARASSDPSFKKQVDAAALLVLTEKQRLGKLG